MNASAKPVFEAPSEAVSAAFMAWARAELACHYASPCPDDVMDHLTDQEREAAEKLTDLSADSATDVLLKVFPFLLYDEFEPKKGDNPLCPKVERAAMSSRGDRMRRVLRDLECLCPELAWALRCPPVREREA